jgi:molecular chaperone DnaK
MAEDWGTEPIVGIDLGTTNSLVAIVEGRRPRVLPVEGSNLLPSVVGIDAEGRRIVGQAARNQYITAPERTVRSIKRRMGRPGETVTLGGTVYTPEEISSFILRRLADEATLQLGREVRRAVITVPAYFTDRQRQATVRAGELAGLDVARLLHEPTAAALAYGLDRAGARTALVYDLGGGTLDVSVVEMAEGITEVRASHGNTQLGGDDFDRLIVEWLLARFQQEHGVDLRTDPVALARVTRAAEAAKIHLSAHAYAEIREEFLAQKGGRNLHLQAELSRTEFEKMIRPLLESTLTSVRTALKEAGIDRRALDEVLLVGGSTHIPAVWELVAEELGKEPRQDISPEEVVALGAAVHAAAIAGVGVDAILVDVCPHSLGVRAVDVEHGELRTDIFVPIIRRNTTIPVSRSRFFYTLFPEQDEVEIEVYQGESPVASHNTRLGRLHLRDLSPSPDGRQREVLVAFDYDLNGILHVAAIDRRSGRREELRLDTVGRAQADGTLPGEAQDLLERLRSTQLPPEAAEARREREELLAEAERLRTASAAEVERWTERAAAFLFEHGGEE